MHLDQHRSPAVGCFSVGVWTRSKEHETNRIENLITELTPSGMRHVSVCQCVILERLSNCI